MTTILCIDDEASGLIVRQRLLESEGYRVVVARSGEDGLRLFQSELINAVILDYWMSGMNGTAVARELKRINPNIPIIVLSGLVELPGETVGLADRWILKGDDPEHLLNTLKRVLQAS